MPDVRRLRLRGSMHDGVAIPATPSSVTVGDAAVAAAIDDDAAARCPIHPIPAPEGRHDRPRWTPGPTDASCERAESEITGREVDRGILSPRPRTIDHGRVNRAHKQRSDWPTQLRCWARPPDTRSCHSMPGFPLS